VPQSFEAIWLVCDAVYQRVHQTHTYLEMKVWETSWKAGHCIFCCILWRTSLHHHVPCNILLRQRSPHYRFLVRSFKFLIYAFVDLEVLYSAFSLFVIASITFVAFALAFIIIALVEGILGTLHEIIMYWSVNLYCCYSHDPSRHSHLPPNFFPHLDTLGALRLPHVQVYYPRTHWRTNRSFPMGHRDQRAFYHVF